VSSKKKAKKGRCFCGKRLGNAKFCRGCGRVTRTGVEANLKKAVAASAGPSFIGKRAGSPLPGQQVYSRAMADLYRESDPGLREAYWAQAQKAIGGSAS
jgi:hypothetical protein